MSQDNHKKRRRLTQETKGRKTISKKWNRTKKEIKPAGGGGWAAEEKKKKTKRIQSEQTKPRRKNEEKRKPERIAWSCSTVMLPFLEQRVRANAFLPSSKAKSHWLRKTGSKFKRWSISSSASRAFNFSFVSWAIEQFFTNSILPIPLISCFFWSIIIDTTTINAISNFVFLCYVSSTVRMEFILEATAPISQLRTWTFPLPSCFSLTNMDYL